MKAKLDYNGDGELIIGYEGSDEFNYPETFSQLKKCENVKLGEKITPMMYEAVINGQKYIVTRQVKKIHGFIREILIAE